MNIQDNVTSLFSFFLLLNLVNKSNAVVGPCIYDSNLRGIIDFTSIGCRDGIPRWKNIAPSKSDGHVYSYNPCYSFNQNACKNVAACQTFINNESLAYELGPQGSIEWIPSRDDDPPAVTYTSGERKLHVALQCLQSEEPDQLQVYGYDETVRAYIMILSSKCACWNGCQGGPSPDSCLRPNPKPIGLSGGAIFIIIFVVFIVIYLIGFMAFNKFKRRETGIEILPHRAFWTSLPGYSLDGVRFIFQKVTGKSGYHDVK